MAARIEAPCWLAQSYAGTVVYMEKGWGYHTNVYIIAVGGDRVPRVSVSGR